MTSLGPVLTYYDYPHGHSHPTRPPNLCHFHKGDTRTCRDGWVRDSDTTSPHFPKKATTDELAFAKLGCAALEGGDSRALRLPRRCHSLNRTCAPGLQHCGPRRAEPTAPCF